MGDKEALEKIQTTDSEGYTYVTGRCTLDSGEVITYPPAFPNISSILQNIGKLKLQPKDIILVSYPKAGAHWMYEILHMLAAGQARPAENYKDKDFIEYSPNIEQLNDQKDFKIINTHMLPKYMPSRLLSQQKIVHIARNPKSVAVSFYFQVSNVKIYCYEGTFKSYLPTFLNGCYTLYGSWFEYMQEWWRLAKKQSNIYTIFYEDLKKNPEKELAKLSQFLEYTHDEEFLSRVAKMSSFETMKTAVGKNEDELRKAASRRKDGQSGIMRTGSIQDWKKHFTVAQNEMFDAVLSTNMKDYPALKSKIQFE